ncbi:FimV/HubP family polar landmark protein [Rheinheimera baltica]|uniref:FimV/HubP family polar landmark protein n=1 Tax=Rheinheimera baltica TaxID=67576 RepID=UPI00273ECFA0|nr:FimV/HubP family polar landmark protein [Rheinheimera baltica]MDP5150682.1 hypothetical protein [Rheinheimera baltica]
MRTLLTVVALICTQAQATETTLGPVQSADTLWKLATQARPDDQVAMVQVIYALWQANPHAFTLNNINALREGSQLNIPQRQHMLSIPVAVARQWYNNAITIPAGRPAKASANVSNQAAAEAEQPTAVPVVTQATEQHDDTPPQPTSVPAIPARQQTKTQATTSVSGFTPPSQDYTLTLQQRYYAKPGDQAQAKSHSRASVSAEWVWQSNDRAHLLALEPFLRWDQQDTEGNLIDLRQAYWQYAGDGYDIKTGVDIVFWGVTESQHLVDVINQTDLIAGVDGEAKLGQPMFNLNRYGSAGTLAVYILPYFRPRTLAGQDGRLRPPLPVNSDQPLYESAQAERNLDFALRWSQQFGALDLALSYFEGNNREPILLPSAENTLQPMYLQMQQLGIEAQLISGSWIWKLESIYRKTRQQDFSAATLGLEYTQVGVFETDWDWAWIAEYQYDSRQQLAPVPGQNDLFIGSRFVANDAAGSEMLLGLVQDLDNSASKSVKLEASMRLSNTLRLRIDAWLFQSNLPSDTLYFIRHDDYFQLSLDYYF